MPKGVYIRAPRAPKQDHPADVAKIGTLYRAGLTQREIAERMEITQRLVFNIMRRNNLPTRKAAPRNQRGEQNNNWRGNNAGYAAMHKRLYALHGKPRQCTRCGAWQGFFDYANLTGNYADPNDYVVMCRSCHWKHDDKAANFRRREKADV